MEKNVGNIDKVIRIVLGLAVGVLGIVYSSWWGLVGLVPIATAIFGTCPAYSLIGLKTTKSKN